MMERFHQISLDDGQLFKNLLEVDRVFRAERCAGRLREQGALPEKISAARIVNFDNADE